MGIYTDYGRYMKARNFRQWAMSGAGIWFGFGIGSPRWDFQVSNGVQPVPNVPTSAPAAFTSLYRWFTSYKGIDPNTGDLNASEYALIDTSYIEDDATLQPLSPIPTKPTNAEIKQDYETVPTDELSVGVQYLTTSGGVSIDNHLWDSTAPSVSQMNYPSPFMPPFPAGYMHDWDVLKQYYNATPQLPPSDPSEYEAYAYWTHFNDSILNPLGFLAFIQGAVHFVEPLDGDVAQSPENTLKTFKYGANHWRIVPESEISLNKLPHHVLLTVNVFPNDLSEDDIAEQYLHVRQVSVFKFPDSVLNDIPALALDNIPRSAQVLRRKDCWFTANTLHPFPPSGVTRIPYGFDAAPSTGSSQYAEMLINDYMTARIRTVQQTDRYGYIVGF